MKKFHRSFSSIFLTAMSLLLFPVIGRSGTWLVDNPAVSIFIDEDDVVHPYLYVGTGGVRTVRICIDPSSPLSREMAPSLQLAAQTINGLQPNTANFIAMSSEVPIGANDFRSVALHELLHCVAGIGHVDLSPEIFGNLPSLSTNSFAGSDGSFNLATGGDGRYGTFDDPRGDDVNLFWFNRTSNNPFSHASIVDETTFSREVGNLPAGHSYAANGNFVSADPAGFPDLKPVMDRINFKGSEVRDLAPDDTVNIRYGAAGLDEAAGTADDYSLVVQYGGVSTAGCNVLLRFEPDLPDSFLAGCSVGAVAIQAGGNHFRLAGTGTIRFNIDKPWHFYGISVFSDDFEAGDLSAWSSTVP